MSDTVVLGVSASHDASACLLINGELVAAIQLERLTRVKHDGKPYLSSDEAIKYCLDSAGVSLQEVDCFAYNIQPIVPGYFGLKRPSHDADFGSFDPFGNKSVFVSHHLAHAFSAHSTSGHKESLTIVADGSGGSVVDADDLLLSGPEFQRYLDRIAPNRAELHCVSVYRFTEHGWELCKREQSPSYNIQCGSSSLGETYGAIANYIFDSHHRSGKVMGLAPYGKAATFKTFLDESSPPNFRADWKNQFRSAVSTKHWMEYADLAARVQEDFSTALVARFKEYLRMYPASSICYSGGLAMNCSTNQSIREHIGSTSLYIPPAPNDAGISLGCAYAGHYKLTGELLSETIEHDFLGHSYAGTEIETAIQHRQSYLHRQFATPGDIAELIANQKIIAIFDGAAEFGARALGHRSIVADARNKDIWEKINAKVKMREDFRPFAPVCRIEDAFEIFETNLEHKFMLETVNVRKAWREKLGAVTHIDGTARLQTVSPKSKSIFYDILTELRLLTNVPVMVNTSLNVRGQPIVETPSQAVDALLSSDLDYLYFPQTKSLVCRKSLQYQKSWMVSPTAKVAVIRDKAGFAVSISGGRGVSAEAPIEVLGFVNNILAGQDVEEAAKLIGPGAVDLVQDLVEIGFLINGS